MNTARIIVALIGIFLPYVARLPRGMAWVSQYLNVGIGGFIFFAALNAIAWGSIIGVSYFYKQPVSLILPALFAFGFLAWAHYSLDLAADAQSAIALVFIPLCALPLVGIGGLIGYLIDRKLG